MALAIEREQLRTPTPRERYYRVLGRYFPDLTPEKRLADTTTVPAVVFFQDPEKPETTFKMPALLDKLFKSTQLPGAKGQLRDIVFSPYDVSIHVRETFSGYSQEMRALLEAGVENRKEFKKIHDIDRSFLHTLTVNLEDSRVIATSEFKVIAREVYKTKKQEIITPQGIMEELTGLLEHIGSKELSSTK